MLFRTSRWFIDKCKIRDCFVYVMYRRKRTRKLPTMGKILFASINLSLPTNISLLFSFALLLHFDVYQMITLRSKTCRYRMQQYTLVAAIVFGMLVILLTTCSPSSSMTIDCQPGALQPNPNVRRLCDTFAVFVETAAAPDDGKEICNEIVL